MENLDAVDAKTTIECALIMLDSCGRCFEIKDNPLFQTTRDCLLEGIKKLKAEKAKS